MAKDKMLFALENMQIASAILTLKNSSFFKRAIARLVLIRVPDFIKYAREFNNETSSNRTRAEYNRIKQDLNALENLYGTYLSELRNKFGGHFKDEDFFERIQLWSDIQVDSLMFFIEHSIEISDLLEPLQRKNITMEPHDISIILKVSEERDLEKQPRFGNDILALSRYNTVTVFNTHELHTKPAMLNSLRLIIDYELDILGLLQQQELAMAFKTLVLVDIISFADTLFTRDIPVDAKQYMEGLDRVVERNGLLEAISIFKKAKSEMKIIEKIEQLRPLRNLIGAHIDSQTPLEALLNDLDNLQAESLRSLYEGMLRLFERICRTDQTLMLSQIGPETIPDAIEVSHQPEKAFDSSSIPAKNFTPPTYDQDMMEIYWQRLLEDKHNKEALGYFSRAFYSSPVLDKWERPIKMTAHAFRYEYPEYCLIHQFLEKKLGQNQNKKEAFEVLHQLIEFRNIGESHILTKILLNEFLQSENPEIKLLILEIVGHTADVYETEIIELLRKNILSTDLDIVLVALVSLARIDTKHNGIRRINGPGIHPGPEVNYHSTVIEKLDSLTTQMKIVFSLIILSRLYFDRAFSTYYEKYTKDVYFNPLYRLLHKYIPRLLETSGMAPVEIQKVLEAADSRYYELTAILIGDGLFVTSEKKAKYFYQIASNGMIFIDWSQDIQVIHRAISLIRSKRVDDAIKIADNLCKNNPENKEYRLFLLDIVSEGKMKKEFSSLLNHLEKDFVLTVEDQKQLEEFRNRL